MSPEKASICGEFPRFAQTGPNRRPGVALEISFSSPFRVSALALRALDHDTTSAQFVAPRFRVCASFAVRTVTDDIEGVCSRLKVLLGR